MAELEEKRVEPGEVDKTFWERTVKEAFKNDPMRIIIELVKNSADSYTRLSKKGIAQPLFKIFIELYCEKRRPPYVKVIDNAEGMESSKLKEALKYGTQTSMGEDIEAITSAEKGIGMKDAMMALKDNWLVTIKDGLINERNKHPDFSTGIGREDEKVTDEDRRKYGIQKNGTVIMGRLPEYFKIRKFSTICELLEKHFLLRKLLQDDNYQIYAINGETKEKRRLKYNPPKIEKKVLEDSFEIKYNGYIYPITLQVYKSEKELQQGKPYGESGLLIFYGKYSVIDFTFFKYDRDSSFSKFFGEVHIEGIDKIIRNPKEDSIVDEKRRGLKFDHPFNQKLAQEIEKRLKTLQSKVESSQYSFDELTKREIIKQTNKLFREISGKGFPSEPPIKPEYFEFYPPYTEIKEFEPKKIFLIINSSIVLDKLEIFLESTNPNIIIKGGNPIKIEKEKIKEEFLIKQIEIYSETPEIHGEIIASAEKPSYKTKIGIDVLENPIFSPRDGFAFVPEKTTVVDGGEKEIRLCIDKSIIKNSREISFSSEGPVSCPGKWLLPDQKNMEKYTIKNIALIKIPIKVKGTNNVGEKAIITAEYENKIAKLYVTIVSEPSLGGLIKDIHPSSSYEKKEISWFDEEKGIIEINFKHPLIRKYMSKKNFRNRSDFLVFIADIITREVIKAFVLSGIKQSSSRFPIYNQDNPENYIKEMEGFITQEYYELGPKLHEMYTALAKTLKIEG